jgi:hypothetical protein
MKSIGIRTIPHTQHRYPTVGDWYNKLVPSTNTSMDLIEVSNFLEVVQKAHPSMSFIAQTELAEKYEFLVTYHEFIEMKLCQIRKVNQAVVDAFDMEYESKRVVGDVSEPGDSKDAPYHLEHTFATAQEMVLAKVLGVDWEAYSNAVNSL